MARIGVKAQIFRDGDLEVSRAFAPWMGLEMTPRQHAVQWAEQERQVPQRGSLD